MESLLPLQADSSCSNPFHDGILDGHLTVDEVDRGADRLRLSRRSPLGAVYILYPGFL
jgi:hypothetical protein